MEILVAAGALGVLLLLAWWGNRHLTVSSHSITDPKIPEAFSGFRILQISDLHNVRFGRGNKRLLRRLSQLQPDILVITGDLLYARSTETRAALDFVREAVKIAPVYYVPGNHEARMGIYPEFRTKLRETGAAVMENKRLQLKTDSGHITLLGIMDPSFYSGSKTSIRIAMVSELLKGLIRADDGFRILLSHRPELFPAYISGGIDLTLAGHVHGGQIRIPGLGGLYGPAQGFFPKYQSGIYREEGCVMIVSRGLGKSLFPFRIHNPPELVEVILHSEKE